MNEKLRNHVNILFAAAPKTAKAEEVKEELLTNLNDKYNDLLAQGYDSTAAFHIAMSGIGNLEELLATCGGAVQWNPPVPPKPIGTVPVVTFTRPAMSKAARIVLYLALALGTPTLGLGLVSFFALADAPGLGVLLMFLCWAASPVFLLLAIVAMFSSDSRQAQEYYQRWVLSRAERHGFSEEFVQNEIRAISRQNKLRSAVLIVVIILLSFFTLSLVAGVASVAVNPKPWFGGFFNTFVPTGTIITEEREISRDFSRIDIQSAIPVVFKQSEQNLIVVETHEDMMPFVRTTVKNNTLTLRQTSQQYRNVQKLLVTVYSPNIPNEFVVSGTASLTIEEPMTTESVSFDSSGAGKIHVNDLECAKLRLHASGASSIDISGKSESVRIQGSGASKFHASSLDTDICDADINGASKVELGTISKELWFSASGASQFHYNGTPVIKKQEVSGAAKVNAR